MVKENQKTIGMLKLLALKDMLKNSWKCLIKKPPNPIRVKKENQKIN